jgi:hypothetical protein
MIPAPMMIASYVIVIAYLPRYGGLNHNDEIDECKAKNCVIKASYGCKREVVIKAGYRG